MCTRTLYVGGDDAVITGRNRDWREDMASDLWASRQGWIGTGQPVPPRSDGPRSTAAWSSLGTTPARPTA